MWQDIFDLQLSVGEKILRALRNGIPVPKALFREGISLPELRAIRAPRRDHVPRGRARVIPPG